MRRVTPEPRRPTRRSPTAKNAVPRSRAASARAARRKRELLSPPSAEAQQRPDPRGRLLLAAAHVFAKGFSQASVAAIVKRAGTSRRTFYEQFDDLTDALVQLYDASARVLLQSVETAFHSDGDARARLTAAIDAYATGIATNADLARIIYSEIRAAGPEQARRHQQTLARFAASLEAWARGARAERLIQHLPDDLTVWATLTGIEGVAMRHVYDGEEQRLSRSVPRLVALVLKAFG
jgi:AcrR family transcriptional regulator